VAMTVEIREGTAETEVPHRPEVEADTESNLTAKKVGGILTEILSEGIEELLLTIRDEFS